MAILPRWKSGEPISAKKLNNCVDWINGNTTYGDDDIVVNSVGNGKTIQSRTPRRFKPWITCVLTNEGPDDDPNGSDNFTDNRYWVKAIRHVKVGDDTNDNDNNHTYWELDDNVWNGEAFWAFNLGESFIRDFNNESGTPGFHLLPDRYKSVTNEETGNERITNGTIVNVYRIPVSMMLQKDDDGDYSDLAYAFYAPTPIHIKITGKNSNVKEMYAGQILVPNTNDVQLNAPTVYVKNLNNSSDDWSLPTGMIVGPCGYWGYYNDGVNEIDGVVFTCSVYSTSGAYKLWSQTNNYSHAGLLMDWARFHS